MRPDLSRVPDFFHNYINQVKENEVMDAIRNNTSVMTDFLKRIPANKHDHRYAEGKWSLKELLQHIIDAERIFSYRALRFARKDTTPLPGFDENLYVQNAKTDKRTWDELVKEFIVVRQATDYLFGAFDEEQLEAEGVSYQNKSYVRAIGFIIAGHCNHHKRVIEERYL